MSLDTALLAATSGLRATARALEVVGVNVANADVAGFTRKVSPQRTIVADGLGLGVRTEERARAVDEALLRRSIEARAVAAGARAQQAALAGVEALHGDPALGTSLGGRIGALRDAFLSLSATPQDPGRQIAVTEAAEQLAGGIRVVADGLLAQRQDAHARLRADVAQANADLDRLATLDAQIKQQVALGRTTADLADARDAVLGALGESLGLRALIQADGGAVLYAPGGFTILPQAGARLELGVSTLGPRSAYDGTAGDIPPLLLRPADPAAAALDITNRLDGGRMAALVDLRDRTLPRMQAELDMLAHATATRFEQQGLRLFTDAAGAVPQNGAAPDATAIAGFASALHVNPAVAAAPRLVRDGTHDVLATDPQPRGTPFGTNDPASGGPEGFSTLIGRVLDRTFGTDRAPATPHALTPATGLGPLGTLSAGFGIPIELTEFGAVLVAQQAGARAGAQAAAEEADGLSQGLSLRLSQESGVDVDAELALMLELQNAYAANARVLAAADEMWRTLLAAVR